MVHIELRRDGWFGAGEDSKETFPMGHSIYKSKQEIKKALEEIGEKPSLEELNKSLKEVPEVFQFRRTPYIKGNDIFIDTPGLPGTCYLGTIKE